MDNNDSPRGGQTAALLWAGMLAPLFHLLPEAALRVSGESAWLVPLLALGPTALGAWLLSRAMARRRPGEALSETMLRAFGPRAGKGLLGLLGLWSLFYGGYLLRMGADRFVSTVYPESPEWLFMGVTLLTILPAAAGSRRALGRCAQLAAPAMALLLLTVFALALRSFPLKTLAAPTPEGLLSAARGLLPFGGALSGTALLLFAVGVGESGGAKGLLAAMEGLTIVAAALCAATLAAFGPALAARISHPFFVLVRNLHFFQPTERMEALAAAQWVVSDFLMLSALLRAGADLLAAALPQVFSSPRGGKAALGLGAGGMLLAGLFCAPSAFALARLGEALPLGNALVWCALGFTAFRRRK